MTEQNQKDEQISNLPQNTRPPTPDEIINYRISKIDFQKEDKSEIKSLVLFIKSSDLSNIDKSKKYRQIFDAEIEYICEMIIAGENFREICSVYGVPLGTFFFWKSTSEHSARIREALEYSAEMDVIKAEEVLLDPAGDKDMADVNRRRELSKFYCWRASKRKPKDFGTKIEETLDVNVNHSVSSTEFDRLLEEIKNKVGQEKRIEAPKQNSEYISFEEDNDSIDEENYDGNE